MENAHLRLATEVQVDSLGNTAVVGDHGRYRLCVQFADRVPAVAALVPEDQVEAVGEQRPERTVGVGRESIAVTQDEARAIGIAVPPENDRSPVVSVDRDRG